MSIRNANIEKSIKKILDRQLKSRGLRTDIKSTDSIITSGILDSLSAIDMIAALEKIFGIKVSMEEMTESNFDSIIKIANFVNTKIKGGK